MANQYDNFCPECERELSVDEMECSSCSTSDHLEEPDTWYEEEDYWNSMSNVSIAIHGSRGFRQSLGSPSKTLKPHGRD